MAGTTRLPQPGAAAVPASSLLAMHVKVRTDGRAVHEYDGLFAHTFDAYDDALARFTDAARIEVRVCDAPR